MLQFRAKNRRYIVDQSSINGCCIPTILFSSWKTTYGSPNSTANLVQVRMLKNRSEAFINYKVWFLRDNKNLLFLLGGGTWWNITNIKQTWWYIKTILLQRFLSLPVKTTRNLTFTERLQALALIHWFLNQSQTETLKIKENMLVSGFF